MIGYGPANRCNWCKNNFLRIYAVDK